MGAGGVEPRQPYFLARDVDLLIDVAVEGRDGAGRRLRAVPKPGSGACARLIGCRSTLGLYGPACTRADH